MMINRDNKKFPERTFLIGGGITLVLFVIAIIIQDRIAQNYIPADFNTEIKPVFLTGNEHYGTLRGAVFYNNNRFISSESKLIENNDNFKDWTSDGPIVDFDTIPYVYKLGDLPYPFFISKSSNSDTIQVIKGEKKLKFLMDDP